MPKNFDVFISHSSIDVEIADALVLYLENRDIKCWIAPRDINNDAGLPYARRIVEGIEASSIMVVVFSKNANESYFVFTEIERAVNYKLTIIPFRVDPAPVSKDLELYLSSVHWLNAVNGKPGDHFYALYKSCAFRLGKNVRPDEATAAIPLSMPFGANVVITPPVETKTPYNLTPVAVPLVEGTNTPKSNLPDNEVLTTLVKTNILVQLFFICIIVVPLGYFLPASVILLNLILTGQHRNTDTVIGSAGFLMSVAIGCYYIIILISRGRKYRAAKKGFRTSININLTNKLSPFIMAPKFREAALLNCFFLIGAVLVFFYRLSHSDPKYFAGWFAFITFIIQYILIGNLICSKVNWLTRFKSMTLVLLAIYLLVILS